MSCGHERAHLFKWQHLTCVQCGRKYSPTPKSVFDSAPYFAFWFFLPKTMPFTCITVLPPPAQNLLVFAPTSLFSSCMSLVNTSVQYAWQQDNRCKHLSSPYNPMWPPLSTPLPFILVQSIAMDTTLRKLWKYGLEWIFLNTICYEKSKY